MRKPTRRAATKGQTNPRADRGDWRDCWAGGTTARTTSRMWTGCAASKPQGCGGGEATAKPAAYEVHRIRNH
jgi:membrane carboxypeptidase/penicillin-binding protein PbpC